MDNKIVRKNIRVGAGLKSYSGNNAADSKTTTENSAAINVEQPAKKNAAGYKARRIAVNLAIFVLISIAVITASGAFSAKDPTIIPDVVLKAKEHSLLFVTLGVTNLNGVWGEWHKAMITSGEGVSYSGYELNKSFLQVMIEQASLHNVYIIYTDNINGDEYSVSMDMDQKNGDFRDNLPATAAMKSAWNGTAAADPNPWDYEKDLPVWTSYAPIYDMDAEIVALLAIDYPTPGIHSFPEWNRSSKKWNGLPVE